MKKISTRNSIISIFFIAFVCVGYFVWATYKNMRYTQRETMAVRSALQVLLLLEEIVTSVDNLEATQKSYVLRTEDADAEPYFQALSNLRKDTVNLSKLVLSDSTKEFEKAHLQHLLRQTIEQSKEAVLLFDSTTSNVAIDTLSVINAPSLTDSIRRVVLRMENKDRILLNESNMFRHDNARNIARRFFILAFLFFGLLIIFFFIINNDLRRRTKGEQQLRYQASLIETISDAIMTTDTKFIINGWNQYAEEMYGFTPKEAMGNSVGQLLKFEFNEGEYNKSVNDLDKKGYYRDEYIATKKNGDTVFVLGSVTVMRNTEAEPIGYIAVHRDITERKILENKLTEFNKHLEEKIQEKTSELSGIFETLQQSYSDIRELAAHLQKVREEERTAMAREIHDELGQQLTGIKMDVSWLYKKMQPAENDIKDKFGTTLQLIDSTVKTVRRLATELRPPMLDDLGLIAAMEWQSSEFEKRSGVSTEFINETHQQLIPPALATGIFRIFQESLTNIARHAAAEKITTVLNYSDNLLTLSIRDNGKGFVVKESGPVKTLGLLGMKERTLVMGGKYKIESEPGAGTVVTVTVPLNGQTKAPNE